MSKIAQFGRQFEVFDPSNKKHREIFHTVLRYKTWGRSPIRFWVDEEQTSLMEQCQKKMATWYLQKEFGKIEVEVA